MKIGLIDVDGHNWKYQRVNTDEWDYDCSCNNIRPLTHPPQSWCYVEEV